MNPYEVAAYYYPAYHADSRSEKWHGKGWTEWDLLKTARPRFAGHAQPKVPLWGEEDEALPAVMEKKIAAAADHALTSWIFDWYWYEDGQHLHRCLDEGFLNASNRERMKFSIMWANHDMIDIHPMKRSTPGKLLIPGNVSGKAFVEATDHCIRRYFSQPNYWRVKGGLYFSIYEVMRMVKGLGGVDATRRIFDQFRDRVRKAGCGDLHLNAVLWGIQILPSEEKIQDPNRLMDALGFDSISSYVWVHHQGFPKFPETPYADIRERSVADWQKFREQYQKPYYPNVTMGWDASPRTTQSDVFEPVGYPFMAMMSKNTPHEFEAALRAAKQFLDEGRTDPKIVSINAWNEWTEGSYLEPDTVHGMKYLEAIRRVFGK